MHVAVSAVGVDRPGIVAAVTKILFEQSANIEDSRMAILGGHFAMMLVVAVTEGTDPGALEAAFGNAAGASDLVVTVRPLVEVAPEHAAGADHVVRVYGTDRPGIVARVSETLAARNVNIRDLATHVIESVPPVYVMLLEVTLPAGADAAAIEADLKAAGEDLGVEVSLEANDAETL